MKLRYLFLALPCAALVGQMFDPAKLLQHPTDTWPTYNGDYSGRRFSPLKQINAGNVNDLTLAWVFRASTSSGFGFRGGAPAGGPGSAVDIKATPLQVNGILYFAIPDHAWAVDARTGRELWHFRWESKGGIHIGNRGFGMYGDWLYFETPDNYLVCLNAKDGTERWHMEIADVKQEYFSTPAPVVIRNHILVGTGGDSLDVPGFLESRDPETGKVQWRWNTTPRKGEAGAETWPNKDAMEHGGGMTWMPGTYDPELNLYYLGTGNPNPVMAGQGRTGSNLWTCSIVALNPDTGKLVWYFQTSPHDTHDWDAVQTPVLIDGVIDGKPRKLLAQANRNGYFFVLDRTNGKNLISKPYMDINWSKGVDAKGQPISIHEKEPKTDGTLVMPASGGTTNWPAPSFDPETGLFYVSTTDCYSVFYLTDTHEKPEGYGGRDAGVWSKAGLTAIDYKTGKVKWQHEYPGTAGYLSGLLTTAGKLLFGGDPFGNFIAFDPAEGHILWHSKLTAPVSNGAVTYDLDGRQYVVVGAGDSLYAFVAQNEVHDHHAMVNQHGDEVMGFSHGRTTHHFLLNATGGAIEVQANDAADAPTRDQIRMHLEHIAGMFAEGNFEAPMLVHGKTPPGVPVMQRLRQEIEYRFEKTDRGGLVRITTRNAEARKAVYAFLRFQIADHQTGDSTEVASAAR